MLLVKFTFSQQLQSSLWFSESVRPQNHILRSLIFFFSYGERCFLIFFPRFELGDICGPLFMQLFFISFQWTTMWELERTMARRWSPVFRDWNYQCCITSTPFVSLLITCVFSLARGICASNYWIQIYPTFPRLISLTIFKTSDISFTKFSICSLSPLGSMSSQTFNNFLPIKFERKKDIINKYTKSLDTATQILKLDSIPMNQHDSAKTVSSASHNCSNQYLTSPPELVKSVNPDELFWTGLKKLK